MPRPRLSYEPLSDDDGELVAAIAEIRRRKPRWGVRRTHHQLRREGLVVNHKRIERLWKEHALAVPAHKRRRKARTGDTVPVSSEYRDHVWTYDIVYDATELGRAFQSA